MKSPNLLWFCLVAVFSVTTLSAQNIRVDRVEELLQLERFHVFNLGEGINSKFSEYNPVLSPNGRYVLYTSRSDTATGQNIYSEDRQFFEDISLAKEKGAKFVGVSADADPLGEFAMSFNSKTHEAPVYISENSETIILFKDNDLWYSNKTDDGYSEPVRYPKNINFKYYHRHASLTADGQTMYFTAEVLDKKTERFHLDLYTTSKDDKGVWQKPKPLPVTVNSLYNEDSPEISADGKMLFFASDRVDGKGGYDIYYVNLTKDTLEPIRLQGPINSAANDIYFKLLPDGRSAYFSSNRLGGYGGMDIYKVTFYQVDELDCTIGLMSDTKVKINGEDTVVAGSFILANGLGSMVSGVTPNFYDWYLNDSLVGSGLNLKLPIDSAGEYTLKLFAASIDSSFMSFSSACESKLIEVLDPESYVQASADDLGIPSENQLLTEQELLDMLPKPYGDIKVANDVASTYQAVPISIPVMDNDPGANETELVITQVSAPRYGSSIVEQARKGTILYYPARSFVGNDGFWYEVQDEQGNSARAYVGIRVLVNPHQEEMEQASPEQPSQPDYAITSSGRLVAVNVFLNDQLDQEKSPRLVEIGKPGNGAARIYDAEEGIVVFAPNGGFEGKEEFTYTAQLTDGTRISNNIIIEVEGRKEPLVAAVSEATGESEEEKTSEAGSEEEGEAADEVQLAGIDASEIDQTNKPNLDLNTIYFDFDKTYIRSDARQTMSSNIEELKKHPKAVIKVVSHCDSWGSSAYNQILSARRAKSTVDYLVSKGIEKDRIIAAVGFGEKQLVNDCEDGVPCTKAMHQQNRRSEFVIVGTMK